MLTLACAMKAFSFSLDRAWSKFSAAEKQELKKAIGQQILSIRQSAVVKRHGKGPGHVVKVLVVI